MRKILLLAALILAQAGAHAANYTWTNLVENGSLGTTQGYLLQTAANWENGVAPTFDDQAHLFFTGLGTGGGSTTIYAGAVTTILNSMTTSTERTLRFNSANSLLSFQGLNPTIDHQNGTLRLEVDVASSGGITKTGAGLVFSNLQSVSAGFTGPLTIAEGMWTSGNNYALGDQKTVNVSAGGSANMNGQLWGSSIATGGTSVTRGYTFNIAGTGTAGEGAIVNNGPSISTTTGLSGVRNLNLTANASVGGSGDYNIGLAGTITGNGHTLTKTGANSVWVSGVASDISYQVDSGRLVGFSTDLAFGGAPGSVSVADGATLASSGTRTFANTLSFDGGATLDNLSNDTATWSGNATLTGGQTIVTGTSATAAIKLTGVVGGNGGITKQSANTLTLENENTYSGKTLITAGTVRLGASASVAESSEINLADNTFFHVADVTGGYELGANQTLSGTGTVVGNTAIQGTLSPGHSSGTLTVDGNAEWTAGANYNWQVLTANTNPADQSAAGTAWDFFDVTGTLNLMGLDISNRFNLNLWSLSSTGPDVNGEIAGWDPNVGNTWRIANANGGISLNGSGLLANTDYSSYFNINTAATNGTGGWVGGLPSSFQVLTLADTNSLYLSAVGSAAVPEPGQVAASILLLAGIGGYVWMKRRKTVKPAPTAV